MSSRKKKNLRIVLIITILFFIVVAFLSYLIYDSIFGKNFSTPNEEKFVYVYIPTGATQKTVIDSLRKNLIVKNPDALAWVMNKKNYSKHIHPGRYMVYNQMSNNQLINHWSGGLNMF